MPSIAAPTDASANSHTTISLQFGSHTPTTSPRPTPRERSSPAKPTTALRSSEKRDRREPLSVALDQGGMIATASGHRQQKLDKRRRSPPAIHHHQAESVRRTGRYGAARLQGSRAGTSAGPANTPTPCTALASVVVGIRPCFSMTSRISGGEPELMAKPFNGVVNVDVTESVRIGG